MNKQSLFQYLRQFQVSKYNKIMKEFVGKYIQQTSSKPSVSLTPRKGRSKNTVDYCEELLKIDKKRRHLVHLKKRQKITFLIPDDAISIETYHFSMFNQESIVNSYKNSKLLNMRKTSEVDSQFAKLTHSDYFTPPSLRKNKLLSRCCSARQSSKRKYSTKKLNPKISNDVNVNFNVTKKECFSEGNQKNCLTTCNRDFEEKFWKKIIIHIIDVKEDILESFSYKYIPNNTGTERKRISHIGNDLNLFQKLAPKNKQLNEEFFVMDTMINYNNTQITIHSSGGQRLTKNYQENLKETNFISQPVKLFKKQNLIPDFNIRYNNIHTTANFYSTTVMKVNSKSEHSTDLCAKTKLDENNVNLVNYTLLDEGGVPTYGTKILSNTLRQNNNSFNQSNMSQDILDQANRKVILSLVKILKNDFYKNSSNENIDGKILQRTTNFNDAANSIIITGSDTANNEMIQISSKPLSLDSKIWKSYLNSLRDQYETDSKSKSQKMIAGNDCTQFGENKFLNHSVSHNYANLQEYLESVQNIDYSKILSHNYNIIDDNIKKVKRKIKELYDNITVHMAECNINSIIPGSSLKDIKRPESMNDSSEYSVNSVTIPASSPKSIKNPEKPKSRNNEKPLNKSLKSQNDNPKVIPGINRKRTVNGSIYKNFDDSTSSDGRDQNIYRIYEEKITQPTSKASIYKTNKYISSDGTDAINKYLGRTVEIKKNVIQSVVQSIVNSNKDIKSIDNMNINTSHESSKINKFYKKEDDIKMLKESLLKIVVFNDLMIKNKQVPTDVAKEELYFLNNFSNKMCEINKIIIENDFDVNITDYLNKALADNKTDNICSKNRLLDIKIQPVTLEKKVVSSKTGSAYKESVTSMKNEKKENTNMSAIDELTIDKNINLNSSDHVIYSSSKSDDVYNQRKFRDNKEKAIKSYATELVEDPAILLIELLQKSKVRSKNEIIKKFESDLNKQTNVKDDTEIEDDWKDKMESFNVSKENDLQQEFGDLKMKKFNGENKIAGKYSELTGMIIDKFERNTSTLLSMPRNSFKTNLNDINVKDEVLVLNITIKIPFSSLTSMINNEEVNDKKQTIL